MSDIRADLEEAFSDDFEEPTSEVLEATPEPTPEVEEEAVPAAAAEASDLGTGSDAEPESEPSPAAEAEVGADGEGSEPSAEPSEDIGKPPLGWAADAREEWGKVPPAARAQIEKREREVEKAMAHTAEAKRAFGELSQLSTTYGSVMAAEGARTPMEAINGLMQTVSQLRLGSPQQKAEKMAHLISHYGIDISALDSALVGEPIEAAPTAQFEQMLDQRLAPVNEMMNGLAGMQQNKQQEVQNQAASEVEQFAQGKEFFADVKADMADILDFTQQRGQKLSLQDAYDRACQFHPTVSQVLTARTQAAAAKKQAAASSIVGTGAGAGGTKEMSMRETIAELYDAGR